MCAISYRLTYWCAGLCPTCCCSHGQTCPRTSSSGKPAPPATAAWWQHSPGNTAFWGGRWTFLQGKPISTAVSRFISLLGLTIVAIAGCSDRSLCSLLPGSESSHTADPACTQRLGRQHLRGIHQITSDLLSESPRVRASVPQHFPGVYSAARSVSLSWRLRNSHSCGRKRCHSASTSSTFWVLNCACGATDVSLSEVTDEMLAFFLTLFQALRVQMGVAFTGQIIHTFLSMFTRFVFMIISAIINGVISIFECRCRFATIADGLWLVGCREQLAASILQEGSAGCRVVQKFLKILQVVVQEPGQAFKPFLPSILSLCIEQVYPIVAEVSWCFTRGSVCFLSRLGFINPL